MVCRPAGAFDRFCLKQKPLFSSEPTKDQMKPGQGPAFVRGSPGCGV